MIEVLWHGRGGQGAFTAARLLGDAVSSADGRHALAFPSFGPERRGAPVRAFTKFGDAVIGDRSAISAADFVVYLDETLLSERWADELKEGGVALVNTTRTFDDPRLLTIDVDRIATEIMGRPQANTALLGALSALCDEVTLEDLVAALHDSLPERHWAGNEAVLAEAARVMADNLRSQRQQDAALAPDGDDADALDASGGEWRTAAAGFAPFVVGAVPDDPADYARTTCYAAPLIVKDNAGWRSKRPVIDALRCTGCGSCFDYCPDGAIVMGARPEGAAPNARAQARPLPAIDELFCKGCGICARVCPTAAIEMVPEAQAVARAAKERA